MGKTRRKVGQLRRKYITCNLIVGEKNYRMRIIVVKMELKKLVT